jgi:hypothetical protein
MRTTSPWPAPSVARGVDPSELAGSHTTPSGIAVTTSGRVSDPASVETVRSAPSATPSASAVAGESRATEVRAVAAS